jgi:hypothetical protein
MGSVKRLDFSVPVSIGLRPQNPHEFLADLSQEKQVIITEDGEEPTEYYHDEGNGCGQAKNFWVMHAFPEGFANGEFSGKKAFFFPEPCGIYVHGVKKVALEVYDEKNVRVRQFKAADFVGAMKACIKNMDGSRCSLDDRYKWHKPVSALEAELDSFDDVEMFLSGVRGRGMMFGINSEKLGADVKYATLAIDAGFFSSGRPSPIYGVVFAEPSSLVEASPSSSFFRPEFEAYLNPREIGLVESAVEMFTRRQAVGKHRRVSVNYNADAKAFKFQMNNYDGKDWVVPISEMISNLGAAVRYAGKLLSIGYIQYQMKMQVETAERVRSADSIRP